MAEIVIRFYTKEQMGNGLFKYTATNQNNLGGICGDSPANVLEVCHIDQHVIFLLDNFPKLVSFADLRMLGSKHRSWTTLCVTARSSYSVGSYHNISRGHNRDAGPSR